MKKRILVTGGAGFVGSHLCRRLLDQGNFVYCLDNLYSGFHENISELESSGNFAFILHDVTTPIDLTVDAIYNLACPASPGHYQADPIHTTRTSVLGAINMLELAARIRAPILQASTSEVYGDPEQHPQKESYWGNVNPLGVRSCYDEGKRCAESLFLDYHRMRGANIRIARIFNTYGPRMHPDDGRVVSNFIVQALTGKDLTIYGQGTQTRCLCYVDDLVSGLISLMNAEGQVIGPVNLGNPVEMTVREIAELILRLTGSQSQIIHKTLPADDPKKRRPDILLAQERLGWKPRVNVEEGLKRTIQHFRHQIGAHTSEVTEKPSMLIPATAVASQLPPQLLTAAE